MFLGKSGLAVGYNGVGMRTVGGPAVSYTHLTLPTKLEV